MSLGTWVVGHGGGDVVGDLRCWRRRTQGGEGGMREGCRRDTRVGMWHCQGCPRQAEGDIPMGTHRQVLWSPGPVPPAAGPHDADGPVPVPPALPAAPPLGPAHGTVRPGLPLPAASVLTQLRGSVVFLASLTQPRRTFISSPPARKDHKPPCEVSRF